MLRSRTPYVMLEILNKKIILEISYYLQKGIFDVMSIFFVQCIVLESRTNA